MSSPQIDPLYDPSFIKDPFPALRAAQAQAPITRHDNLSRTYSVYSYKHVRSIFEHPEVFSSEVPQAAKDRALGKLLDTLIATDPPRHRRLRTLANKAFTPRALKNFESRAQEVVAARLNAVLDLGDCDLVEDFSAQITVGMITAILGLPLEDWPMIRRWTTDISNNAMSDLWLKQEEPQRYAVTESVTGELSQYFADYLRDRRASPREGDLISMLMEAEVDGDRLSDDEVEATAMLLLLAGNETTTNLITNFVRCMVWYPEQAALLREQPELVPQAVEETLRMRPSLRGTARRIKKPFEFLGINLEPGDSVFGWICAANRDSSIFDNPDQFDATRKPNRHLAFASGPHICLGAPLARMETRIAADAIMRNTKSIELTGESVVAPNAVLDNILSQPFRILPA